MTVYVTKTGETADAFRPLKIDFAITAPIETNADTEAAQQMGSQMTVLKSVEQAAEFLGLKTATLNQWRTEGRGPLFCKLGRRVAYRQEDLDAFVTQGLRTSTSAGVAEVA